MSVSLICWTRGEWLSLRWQHMQKSSLVERVRAAWNITGKCLGGYRTAKSGGQERD